MLPGVGADQLQLGEPVAPAEVPARRVELAARTFAGFAVGARWPSWEKVPRQVQEVALRETGRALNAILEAAADA